MLILNYMYELVNVRKNTRFSKNVHNLSGLHVTSNWNIFSIARTIFTIFYVEINILDKFLLN